MAYYIRNGNTYRVTDEAAVDIKKELPVGAYIVKVDQFGNFFLEMTDAFESMGKVYGDATRNAKRILDTFLSRKASTGVLLAGEKGSGKTMLAKQLSMDAAKLGIPTILINTPFCGDTFNKFMQDIDVPAVVLFDEFEKIYDSDKQEAMLTLLDGVYPTKKLFMVTCNDKWRIDSNMRNRPGRIFYFIEFGGLSVDFVREYCQDMLEDKTRIESVCRVSMLFDKFNFDMLKAMVEEMNRYDEDAQTAMKLLNAKPEYDGKTAFNLEVFVDGHLVPKEQLDSGAVWVGNPLTQNVNINWFNKLDAKTKVAAADTLTAGLVELDLDEDEEIWLSAKLKPNDLSKIDAEKGVFIFRKEEDKRVITVALTRVKETAFDYHRAF